VTTRAQPIGVDDVLSYLQASIYLEEKKSLIIDIGAEQLNYKEMMLKTAAVLDLKRYVVLLPFLTINLSSYWLNLFTPVPFGVAKALIEGVKSEVVIQNNNAQKYFPNINPMSYTKAVEKSVYEIRKNQVISRWSDRYGKAWDQDHAIGIHNAIYVDRKIIDVTHINKQEIYKSFTSIGGSDGWFAYDFLWKIRGAIDKAIGGVGLKRGRRDQYNLRVGDSLDFWKVVDIQENRRLLLFAQMKIPGSAWLEFKIAEDKLIQSAYFYPKGVLGRIYWYILVPVHYFVFNNMIKSIVKKAQLKEQ
jgi:hypothetical protein